MKTYDAQDKQMAGLALRFMTKVQLTGEEVGMFSAVNNWLVTVANAPMSEPQRHDTMLSDDGDGAPREHHN